VTDLRKIAAMIRATWLHVISYRLQLLVSLVGLFTAIVPVYFVSNALQPMMASTVADEGGQYFGFVIVGVATYFCIASAVGALHSSLNGEIRSGGLEALLSTPTPLGVLLLGMMGQALSVTAMRVAVMILAATMLGAKFAASGVVLAVPILLLLVLAYAGFGMFAASMVLAFKTPGPLPALILAMSALFGGVYYPPHVIPSWLQLGSYVMPLTYGLRPLRQALLEGASFSAVSGDVFVLTLLTVALLVSGTLVFAAALRYARATGTLAQY
jgi:ABC-type polysaccharide/polyol phosphate export permease